MAARSPSLLFFVSALVLLGACSSHQDSVCEDIGDCAQGGSTDWIASCQSETKALRDEAASDGCASAFDAYFSCADSSYSCQGATALFPGCADRLAALDACLASATASSACARLATNEASCGSGAPDAGTPTGTPPACTAARDCQAQCYLDHVADVCAPRVDEIPNVSTCAASCPL